MMLRRATLLSAAFAVPALFAGASHAQSGDTLNLRLQARDLGSIDPALTKTGDDETIVLQIFNSLVTTKRGTMDIEISQLQPELAQSWEISPDKRTWTFRLRPGVKWQKGYGEVSAEDVKFSYERQLDPALGGVHGASFKDIAAIDAIDALTVRFTLKEPNAFFHATALTPGFGRFIVPKKAVEALGERFGRAPVGSGPFEFVEYRPQESIVLRANRDYFRGTPPTETLRFRYIPADNAATIAFIGGELDQTGGPREPRWVEQIQKQRPNSVISVMQPGSLQFLHFNMKVKPLDDVRVRRAIAHAVDRRLWASVFGVVHGPLPAIVPEEFYGALKAADIPADLRYDHDLAKAKALLAEAGYPNGFTIEALSSERSDYRQNMLMVQDQVRKVGINIQLKIVDHASYHAAIRKDEGTIAMLSTAIAPTAPAVINEFLHSAAAVGKPASLRNFSHYGVLGGTVDALVDRAVGETDVARQLDLLKQAQLQILRDMPVLPLQTQPLVSAIQGNIDLGYKPSSGFGQYEYATARRVRK
jgi:peptide/nickel transport system substrate-binding protein